MFCVIADGGSKGENGGNGIELEESFHIHGSWGWIYLRCPSLETATRSFTKMTHVHIKQFLLFCSLTALDANYAVLSGLPHDAVSICLVVIPCALVVHLIYTPSGV